MWPKIYFWLTWMQNINHPIMYHRLPSHLQSCYWENINWPTHLYNWCQKIQLSGIQFSQNRQPHTYIACQIYKQIFNMSSDISHLKYGTKYFRPINLSTIMTGTILVQNYHLIQSATAQIFQTLSDI